MHFAYPFPWWAAIVVAAGAGLLAAVAYRRPLTPLTIAQRGLLTALRALTLATLALLLFRPVVLLPPVSARAAVVPVLVDVSRSMRLADADGLSRIDRAVSVLKTTLLPALTPRFDVVLLAVGDGVAPNTPDGLHATARRSDVAASLAVVRDRYRGQSLPGIILLSDGGDTSPATAAEPSGGPPVFSVGLGLTDQLRDREILGISAGDPKLDQASVDVKVSAVSHGFGRAPFQLRLLANGRVVETRRVVLDADASPIDELFTVTPDPLTPTVFTAEIPAGADDAAPENNARSVLMSPAGRKRRLLVIEGAPGFEHSFFTRALARDPGLEIDSVTRKGKNADGRDTFFVQAGAGRESALTTGFPARREDLYAYDAVVIANVEGDFFTRAQLAMTADFVADRGGGLLVMGGRSFAQRGLMTTPLEVALPVELDNRRGASHATLASSLVSTENKLVVTPEGESHPIMRIGGSPDETRKLWAALPALAASAPLGGPRPGATVLAVSTTAGGVFPMVAVQRFGRGRSMVFGGEASWRWKMLVASTDRTYERFWRQTARWLAGPSPDPVAVSVPEAPEQGDTAGIDVDVRDAAFAPVPDAELDATMTLPGGATQKLTLKKIAATSGRFTLPFQFDQPGLYHVRASARRGSSPLGDADTWVSVGGADREFADPRLNEGFLRRVARSAGGRYVRAADASQILSWLEHSVPQTTTPERRDLWHEPWVYAWIVSLLAIEWTLRRRWGLR